VSVESKFDDVVYKIDIEWVQEIKEGDRDLLVFLKVFLNSLLR
jgi:hypothetical protein